MFLPIFVDGFAGGGGASTGIEQALQRVQAAKKSKQGAQKT